MKGVFSVLTRLLYNEDNVDDLCRVSPRLLTPAGQQALARINRHYARKKNRGGKERKAKSKSQTWSCILRLEVLNVPDSIEVFLESNDWSAQNFLAYDDNQPEELGRQIPRFRNIASGDAFDVRFEYTMRLRNREEHGAIRRCFAMLMWFDIVKTIRPDITGSKFGDCVAEDLREELAKIYVDDHERVENVAALVPDWCKQGKRIDHICQEFGLGAIFFLAPQLSSNFLHKLFSFKGETHNLAFQHLHDLGLHTQARRQDLHKLATDLRRLLGLSMETRPRARSE